LIGAGRGSRSGQRWLRRQASRDPGACRRSIGPIRVGGLERRIARGSGRRLSVGWAQSIRVRLRHACLRLRRAFFRLRRACFGLRRHGRRTRQLDDRLLGLRHRRCGARTRGIVVPRRWVLRIHRLPPHLDATMAATTESTYRSRVRIRVVYVPECLRARVSRYRPRAPAMASAAHLAGPRSNSKRNRRAEPIHINGEYGQR
jgi:hypothetical protein